MDELSNSIDAMILLVDIHERLFHQGKECKSLCKKIYEIAKAIGERRSKHYEELRNNLPRRKGILAAELPWPNPTVVNLPVVTNNGAGNNAVPIYEYNPNFAAGTVGPINFVLLGDVMAKSVFVRLKKYHKGEIQATDKMGTIYQGDNKMRLTFAEAKSLYRVLKARLKG